MIGPYKGRLSMAHDRQAEDEYDGRGRGRARQGEGRAHERLVGHYTRRRSESPRERPGPYGNPSLGRQGSRPDDDWLKRFASRGFFGRVTRLLPGGRRMEKRDREPSRMWPRSPSRSPSRSRSPSPAAEPAASAAEAKREDSFSTEAPASREGLAPESGPKAESERRPSGEPSRFGGAPASSKLADIKKEKAYGEQLLPGEGSAMASYVASGARIPRRGEIGLSQNEIGKFESSGYVMSGSRHAVMNAVRLRKENQVISSEGRMKLAMEAFQEKQKREDEVVKSFKSLINERLRRADEKQPK